MNCCDCPEKDYCNPAVGCSYEPYIGEPTEEEWESCSDPVTMSEALKLYFGM